MFERSLDEQGVEYRSITFSSGTSLRRSLQGGIGITLCPAISVSRQLQTGQLKQLVTKDIIAETPVIMIWHIDKWCSSLLKFFMDLTQEIVQ